MVGYGEKNCDTTLNISLLLVKNENPQKIQISKTH